MTEQKLICYTLDLEHDYAGLSPLDEYEAFSHTGILDKLSNIIRRYELKLTVFATGKVLHQKKETVDFFQALGAEIELHGYNHVMYQPNLAFELQKGVDVYRKTFGKIPLGYRSPGGVFSSFLLKALAAEGIRYDSSIIPSYRRGVYKNLKSPMQPFYDSEASILELPIGVVPKIRIPIAASYIRLLGLSTYKLLFALFGITSPIVYLFHLVDLIPTQMRKKLSPFWRYIYAKGQGKGIEVFEKSVKHFKHLGYKPEFMSHLYKTYSHLAESSTENKHPIE
ncbi:MAG: polysaccharide deacetylase family protein [Candidatus Aminicenantes bacterium]|nr:MAG: polysaccharide deacetylase family protein [Candidatus Aminicenantes bacterium]